MSEAPPEEPSTSGTPEPVAPGDPAEPTLARADRPSAVLLVAVAGISAAADLGTKAWATAALAGFDQASLGPRKIDVIPGLWSFIFAQNPGGAWSFLRSVSEDIRRPFFLFVSAAAIVFITSIYFRIHKDQWPMKWGLPLALGGAIGNLVDRIRFGWVVDFIDFYVVRGGREIHWPTFNVADIAIVLGVALMGVDMLRGARQAAREPVSPRGEGRGQGDEPGGDPAVVLDLSPTTEAPATPPTA